MRKCLVSFRHLMSIFLLLDGAAHIVGGIISSAEPLTPWCASLLALSTSQRGRNLSSFSPNSYGHLIDGTHYHGVL